MVVAVGADGSYARRAQQQRTCGAARCQSRLPTKFTDEECDAYLFCWDNASAWTVDYVTKEVTHHWDEHSGVSKYANLIEFAKHLEALEPATEQDTRGTE
jgi:hypothetical protein